MDKRSLLFVLFLTVALFFVHEWFDSKDSSKKAAPAKPVVQEEVVSASNSPAFVESNESKEERFYVLENNYQQLVFSNIGGALSEINLPLKSKENQASVIRKIGFDRTLEEDYAQNDHFPVFPYFTSDGKGGVVKVAQGQVGGYYPLLRRSIAVTPDQMPFRIAPRYYALNLVSEDPSVASAVYKLKKLDQYSIEFEASLPNRKITKTFSLPKDAAAAPYCLELTVRVDGDARGLWLTTGVPEVELVSGSATPVLKYRLTKQQKPVVEQVDLPKLATSVSSIRPDWICNSNGFFGIIIDPLTEAGPGFGAHFIPGQQAPTRLSLIDPRYDLYPADKYPGYEMRLPLRAAAQTSKFRMFGGPFVSDILQQVDATYSNPATGYNPDYVACQSFQGWFAFISEPFAKFLFILMKFFYKITYSWGISIILLTVALRIMLYPLNAWSIKSTMRMQKIAPRVSAIQQKYKKDPKRSQMEIMALYKEAGANPLTGCFPILIQMPFLIGMFDLLKSTFELRGATFIPGWIDNLAAPDVLFSWNYPVIFFGTNFHLLPIILGVVMYLQQKFSAGISKSNQPLTDQQKQQKMMSNIMAIVFAVMFYHFPSGLNLYWLSSMLLGILQQWWMNRKQPPDKSAIIDIK
jgi:YidC/Oxa1 family membrane protein insertase